MKVKRLNNRDVWQDEIMTMLNRFGNDDADKRYLMELNKRIVQHINNISRNNTSVALRQWNAGDSAFFYSKKKHRTIFGTITQINRTSVSIDCGVDGKWKVAPTLLAPDTTGQGKRG
jgi:hypothetical protein